ncbi:MAG: mechanosensitive ion channel family protein [Guyparkeria sp.]
MSIHWPTVAYVLPLAVAVVLLVLLMWRWMMRLQRGRERFMSKVKRFDVLRRPKSARVREDIQESQRAKAIDKVRRRFSVLRRVSLIALVTVGLLLVAIPFLGKVPAALVSLLVAISGVVVGIAARPLVENMISGLVLSAADKIHVGDVLYINDQFGSVEDVSLTHTVIKIWNWQRLILPNSVMLAKELLNLTHREEYLYTHVEFCFAPDADFAEVKRLAIAAVHASTWYTEDYDPEIWVTAMDRDHIRCWVAAWVKGSLGAWYLRSDVRTYLVTGFQEAGIATHLHRVVGERPFGLDPAEGNGSD